MGAEKKGPTIFKQSYCKEKSLQHHHIKVTFMGQESQTSKNSIVDVSNSRPLSMQL